MKPGTAYFLLMAICLFIRANEYHVEKSGNDSNPGTAEKPFLTIQAAADKAVPGDVITVHEGIYRKWVKPPNGGTSDSNRIIYCAAENGKDEASDRTLPDPFEEPGKGTFILKIWPIR